MKKYALVTLLSALLLPCAVARAGDGTLLEQLQKETRALAEAANRTLVRVVVQPRRVVVGDHHTVTLAPDAPFASGVGVTPDGKLFVTPHVSVPVFGVLVGSPARLVVAHDRGNPVNELDATLADGTAAKATLLDGDAELGVAVYALPQDIAAKWQGLEPVRRWEDIAPGSLALESGSRLGVTLVRETDPALGLLRADVPQPQGMGLALVGPGRTLLGLARRAGVTAVAPSPTWTGRLATSAAAAARKGPAATATWPLGYTLADVPYFRGATAVVSPGTHVAGPVIARVLDDIAETGKIRHAYLGVILGARVGKGDEAGVEVSTVLEGSPAAGAGLRAGHRILRVNGRRVRDPKTLTRILVLRRPGDQVALEWRDTDADSPAKGTVTLGDRAEAQDGFVTEETLGLKCQDLGPELRRFMGLADEDKGVAVCAVRRDGAAYRAGLRRDDLIVWGGGGDIADLEELRAVLAAAKGSVVLRWRRPGLSDLLGGTVTLPGSKRSPR